MAFTRPTLPEIVDRVQQDFVSRLELVGAVLRRSVVHVLSRVVAGAAHMLHGHLDYLGRQLLPDTSEGDYLVRQAAVFGVTRKPADFAEGDVTVTGSGTVDAGAILQRSDGVEYEVTDGAMFSGVGEVSVRAFIAGADGTLTVGDVLSFESPVDGVDSAATVDVSTKDGVDAEPIEELRARFLARLRSPPQGGASTDYEAWALEVPGVTRAWVYRHELGVGTVTVRFMRDDDVAPIPDSGEVADVQEYIDARSPVTAVVTVAAPVAAPVALTLSVTPDTTATRAAVVAELTDLLRREAEPGATTLLSKLRTAIGSAEGVTNYTLTTPSADVTHTTGQLATVGTITWT
jgi:uncharacterized phage protein gp47/JayE